MSGIWLVSYVVLWLLVLVLAFTGLAILRQLGLVYARTGGSLGALQTSDGLPLGATIPATDVLDVHGVAQPLAPTKTPFKIVLLMSPTCEVCKPMIPSLPSFAAGVEHEAELLVVLNRSDGYASLATLGGERRIGGLRVAVEPSLLDILEIPATPYAVVVDQAGQVASKGVVNNIVQLESVLNEALTPAPTDVRLEEARHA